MMLIFNRKYICGNLIHFIDIINVMNTLKSKFQMNKNSGGSPCSAVYSFLAEARACRLKDNKVQTERKSESDKVKRLKCRNSENKPLIYQYGKETTSRR